MTEQRPGLTKTRPLSPEDRTVAIWTGLLAANFEGKTHEQKMLLILGHIKAAVAEERERCLAAARRILEKALDGESTVYLQDLEEAIRASSSGPPPG